MAYCVLNIFPRLLLLNGEVLGHAQPFLKASIYEKTVANRLNIEWNCFDLLELSKELHPILILMGCFVFERVETLLFPEDFRFFSSCLRSDTEFTL